MRHDDPGPRDARGPAFVGLRRRAAPAVRTAALLAVLTVLLTVLGVSSSDANYTNSTADAAPLGSANAYAYSSLVAGSSPWLWWRLGDTNGSTAADSSGNARGGTLSTAGISRSVEGAVLGDSSTAYHFDGVAGCIASAATLNNPNPITLEAWARTTSNAGGLVIGFGPSSATATGLVGYDPQLFFTATGQLALGASPGGVAQTITTPGSYNDGRWHLVDAVINASAAKIYVDGALTVSGAGGDSGTNNYWHVGCGTIHTSFTGAPTSGYLAADLDEVAIYTSALSATAIADRFGAAPSRRPYAETVNAGVPWAWWRLGEGTSATMTDATANARNGTTSSSGLTAQQAGAVAGSTATRFDGTAGCAVSSTAQVDPEVFSLEAWFKTTSGAGGPIAGFMDNAGANLAGSTNRDRQIYLNGAGVVSFGVLSSGLPQVVSSGTGGFDDGAWHHVVATLGPSGQVLYLDGVAVAFSGTTSAQSFTGYWHIGCQSVSAAWPNYPGSNFFTGTLDEVAVYNSVLDAPTVQRHFRSGAAPPGYTDLVSTSAPWAWWRLGELTRHELTDASGNGNRGWTSDGGITRGVPGILGGDSAMHFNGSTGCGVAVGSLVNPTTFSVETWFRTTTTTGGGLFGFSDSPAPTVTGAGGHDRNLYLRDNGTLTFGTWIGSAAIVTTSTAYNDGRWHHVVVTLSSGGMNLYVDGALQATSANTAAQSFTGYWHLGCGDSNGAWPGHPTSTFLAGDLDEVAIYSTALSATAVASHFRAGLGMLSIPAARSQSAPWAVWRLSEAAGTALTDDTGNGHGATATASGITYGSAGVLPDDGAARFDGVNGCTVATTSSNDPQLFSIEAWFSTTTTTGGSIVGFNPVNTTAFPGSPYDRGMFMNDTGQIAFMVYPGSFVTVTSTTPYNDGAWHHAVATLGPHGQKLYVDGALVGSNANTVAYSYGGYWRIGCNNMSTWPGKPTSSYFNGAVDEVAVYETELDAATIAYRASLVSRPPKAAADAVATAAPTLYWPLDEGSGNPADASGSAHPGTASGSGITRGVAPAVGSGSAWTFDGSAGCAVSTTSFANPLTFSLSAWVRTTSASGGGIIGFTDSSAAGTAGTNYDRQIYLRNDGLVGFGVVPGAGSVVTSTTAINDGRWHLVSATLGAGGQKLYIDGTLEASSANTAAFNFTGYWHVGCTKLTGWPSAPTSSFLSGTIDEVVVTLRQLTDAAVREQATAGNGTHAVSIAGPSIITTVFGNGTASSTGDGGAATSATVNAPNAVEVDAQGNLYVSDSGGCRIRKVAPNGIASTIVGTGTCSATGDGGAATSATIGGSSGAVVAPDGGLYVSDGGNARVRRVSAAGTISTFAGTGTSGTTGDGGAATAAQITIARGIAVDAAGSLFITFQNGECRVRKVTVAGIITTVAGTGTCSTSGDGGAATSATINNIVAVGIGPDGSLYLAEWGGCRIRKVDTAGIITTVVGTGTCSSGGDGGAATSATINHPSGVVGDQYGNLYVSEQTGNRVRKIDPTGIISTIAGTGTASSTGDGGAASSATLNGPYGLAIDGAGRLLVAEAGGHRVRRIG